MRNEIIIKLIVQDMKYQKFVNIIYKENGIPNEYEINLLEIVALNLGMNVGNITDKWIDTYMCYIHSAFTINDDNDRYSLAEKAYQELYNITNIGLFE